MHRVTKYGPLRWAKADDIPQLLALEAALFDNAMAERTLRQELETGRGYVYDVMGELAGYALIREDGNKLDLTRLGVDPEAQGGGIGTVLLKHVIGLGAPIVLTVLKSNLKAIRLYRRHGFVITGHLLNSYEAWSMRRDPSGA
jgi:ribosomal protein S18 acetylase RimI-like enzyme